MHTYIHTDTHISHTHTHTTEPAADRGWETVNPVKKSGGGGSSGGGSSMKKIGGNPWSALG